MKDYNSMVCMQKIITYNKLKIHTPALDTYLRKIFHLNEMQSCTYVYAQCATIKIVCMCVICGSSVLFILQSPVVIIVYHSSVCHYPDVFGPKWNSKFVVVYICSACCS